MIHETITFSGRNVFLFGSNHSTDKSQLDLIRSSIEKFNPEVILVEGNFDKANFNSIEDSIKKGREMGYVSFICNRKKIPLISNDPLSKDDKEFIRNKYNDKIEKLYFLLRDYSIKRLSNEDLEFIEFFFKDIFNENFDILKNYSDYFNPTIFINLFNKITRELNEFRDNYMLCKIKELLKTNSKIFIIKGNYHLESNLFKIKNIVYGT